MQVHREVYFMGRIAAATTHELRNILAIIKETLGLLEDLAGFSPKDTSIEQYQVWLKKSLITMTDQVMRGITLVQHYNRFAHVPDHPVLQINVRDSIQHLITLCAHIIRLRQVKVEQEIATDDPDISLVTCPLYFYMTIFFIMDRFMNQLPRGSKIIIKVDRTYEDTVVSFRSIVPEGKPPEDFLSDLANVSIEVFSDIIKTEYYWDEKNGTVRLKFRDLDPDDFASRYLNKR